MPLVPEMEMRGPSAAERSVCPCSRPTGCWDVGKTDLVLFSKTRFCPGPGFPASRTDHHSPRGRASIGQDPALPPAPCICPHPSAGPVDSALKDCPGCAGPSPGPPHQPGSLLAHPSHRSRREREHHNRSGASLPLRTAAHKGLGDSLLPCAFSTTSLLPTLAPSPSSLALWAKAPAQVPLPPSSLCTSPPPAGTPGYSHLHGNELQPVCRPGNVSSMRQRLAGLGLGFPPASRTLLAHSRAQSMFGE